MLSPTLCDPMDYSMPGFTVLHYLLEFAHTHVHWVSDAIQPSHPLSSPFPPAFNLSPHQSLFQYVGSLHQMAKVLEFQLQHQSFWWRFRINFLWDWLVWSKELSRVFSSTTVWKHQFFSAQPSGKEYICQEEEVTLIVGQTVHPREKLNRTQRV